MFLNHNEWKVDVSSDTDVKAKRSDNNETGASNETIGLSRA